MKSKNTKVQYPAFRIGCIIDIKVHFPSGVKSLTFSVYPSDDRIGPTSIPLISQRIEIGDRPERVAQFQVTGLGSKSLGVGKYKWIITSEMHNIRHSAKFSEGEFELFKDFDSDGQSAFGFEEEKLLA